MAETKWTPGSWFAERASDTVNLWGIKSDQCPAFFVAEVFLLGAQDSAEANARLIAAGPELYAALAKVVECYGYGDSRTTMTAARAALAKARGE